MGSDQLVPFLMSRPFEPFKITLVAGREVIIKHPEFITASAAAMGVWFVHETGHLEAISNDAMISITTMGPVDPTQFFR
jgi:hypothetical protein